MPWTMLSCPESAPTHGEAHTPEYCISECQNKCIAPPLLAGMMASNARNPHRGKLISVSALGSGGCGRKMLLERTLDYADTPISGLYAYRGTVCHQIVEDSQDFILPSGDTLESFGILQEYSMLLAFCFEHGPFSAPSEADPYDQNTWLGVVCPECKRSRRPLAQRDWFFLSGTLDCFQPRWDTYDPNTRTITGTIYDLKTAASYAVDKVITGDAKKDSKYDAAVKNEYVEQVNTYAYMLEQIPVPEKVREAGKSRGMPIEHIVVDKLQLQFISMSKFPLTGSNYMHRKHWTHKFSPFSVPEVPRFDDQWAEGHIKTQAWKYYEAMILGKGRGQICEPTKNNYKAHSWLCGGFCSMHNTPMCPHPETEYAALQDGKTEEEAFALAKEALKGLAAARIEQNGLAPTE